MKIAIYNPRISYFIGGSEITTIEFAKILSEKHEVTIITSSNKKTQNFIDFEDRFKKIKFKYFECPKSTEYPQAKEVNGWDYEGLFFGESTKEFLDSVNFDIIVTFYSTDLVTLNKKDTKTILHLQGYPPRKKMLDTISFSKADFLVANSEHVCDTMKINFKINVGNIFYSGPNPDEYIKRDIKRDIDILYLGRLTERKGADLLIQSLNQNKDHFKKCIIAGTGEIEEKLKLMIKEYNLDNKIKLAGIVEKEEAINLLNRSKLFVLPARKREPCPKSIIEAMFMGCAVISTNVGGIPEIIIPGKTGILVNPNNEMELAESIKDSLLNKKKTGKIAKMGEKMAKQEYNLEKKKEELLELYSKLLGEENGKN